MKKVIIRGSILAIAAILFLVVVSYNSLLRTANNVSWRLPNNDRLSYLIYNDSSGFVADIEKIILWRKSDGSIKVFNISRIGGAPQEVQLKINEKKSVLWLIGIYKTIRQETHKYLCAIDIETGDFASSSIMKWNENTEGELAVFSKNPNIRLIKEVALEDEGHIIRPN